MSKRVLHGYFLLCSNGYGVRYPVKFWDEDNIRHSMSGLWKPSEIVDGLIKPTPGVPVHVVIDDDPSFITKSLIDKGSVKQWDSDAISKFDLFMKEGQVSLNGWTTTVLNKNTNQKYKVYPYRVTKKGYDGYLLLCQNNSCRSTNVPLHITY